MRSLTLSALACVLTVAAVIAQQPAALKLTATSSNVSEPGAPVRIEIFRWSLDQERDQLLTALNPAPPPPPAVPAVAAAPAGGGRGDAGTRGGRGGAGARGARGGAGGRGRGGPATPSDPISSLTAAINRAPTLGYIWTNEAAGYSIKYAVRLPSPDGGELILLATNRRLGAHSVSWQPKGTPTAYEFTFIEIRLNSRGQGEGKASLTASIAPDTETKTIKLENYAAAPALFAKIKRD